MAKKAKKPSKGKSARGQAQPLAVLYRLDAGTPRGDAVRAVLADQGIRVRTATAGDLTSPVGALAGLPGMRPSARPFEGEAPECEFMLLHGVSSAHLSALLAALREADASVGCKAQVTQHNRLWPFATLIAEVSREHALMNEEAPEDGDEAPEGAQAAAPAEAPEE